MATVPLGGIQDLEKKYKQQMTEYNALVSDSIRDNDTTKLDKIRQLNQSIATTLDEMISVITQAKQKNGNIEIYRDELIAKLQRIQKDYNGLLQNTDTLETLRRIRNQEEKEANGSIFWLVGGFIVLCILTLLAMMFFGSQKAESATMMPTSVATTMPLI